MKPFTRLGCIAIIAVVLQVSLSGQASDATGIRKAIPLSYPTVARLARIQGDVRLALVIARTGEITSVSKVDGADALAGIAAGEIQKWRYTSSNETWHATFTIHYSLHSPALSVRPVARFEINTPFDVSVSSNYPLPTGNPEIINPK
jgi:hypothetical protein